MNWTSTILVAVFLGTLSLAGCGDDDGGGGGGSPCSACTARQNECEEAYAFCVAENPPAAQGDCDAFGLAACEVVN